jgi:hypothetical protein
LHTGSHFIVLFLECFESRPEGLGRRYTNPQIYIFLFFLLLSKLQDQFREVVQEKTGLQEQMNRAQHSLQQREQRCQQLAMQVMLSTTVIFIIFRL